MWQATNHRARAVAAAKRREKRRNKRPFALKRVEGELKIKTGLGKEPVVTDARIVLMDITPKGMGLFCGESMPVGQEVSITLEHPQRFYVLCRIVWCQEVQTTGHVISKKSYQYRVGVQFVFNSEEEEAAVKKFVEELTAQFGQSAA